MSSECRVAVLPLEGELICMYDTCNSQAWIQTDTAVDVQEAR